MRRKPRKSGDKKSSRLSSRKKKEEELDEIEEDEEIMDDDDEDDDDGEIQIVEAYEDDDDDEDDEDDKSSKKERGRSRASKRGSKSKRRGLVRRSKDDIDDDEDDFDEDEKSSKKRRGRSSVRSGTGSRKRPKVRRSSRVTNKKNDEDDLFDKVEPLHEEEEVEVISLDDTGPVLGDIITEEQEEVLEVLPEPTLEEEILEPVLELDPENDEIQEPILEPEPAPEPEPEPETEPDPVLISEIELGPLDEKFMKRALELAVQGVSRVAPNPMVGAVVVQDGQLVSEGFHATYGGPHAEVTALMGAGDKSKGSTLYVTLEPCNHTGQTPACTKLILGHKVARVVAAVRDPNPRVAGGGIEYLEQNGVAVHVGMMAEAAKKLNAPYFKAMTTGYPYIIAKWAMTMDGKIATIAGQSKWITDEETRNMARKERFQFGAVAVGINTILKDDPLLTCHGLHKINPKRVVFDSELKIPLDCQLVKTANLSKVIVVTTERGSAEKARQLKDAGVKVIRVSEASGKVHFREAMKALVDYGIISLMIEGGQELLGSAFDAALVDRVKIYIGPSVFGGIKAPGPIGGVGIPFLEKAWKVENLSMNKLGDDIILEGDLIRNK